jgi:hypothetical protein
MNVSKQESKSPKKSYQTPTLRVYGDLHEITQANAAMPGAHLDARGPFYGCDRTH